MIVVAPREDDPRHERLLKSLQNASLVPPECAGQTHVMVIASDCHVSREACAAQFKINGTTIISVFHAQISFEALHPPPSDTIVAHVPFCVVDDPLAEPLRTAMSDISYNMAERTGSLVLGKQGSAYYPLRSRLKRIVDNGGVPGGRVNQHPGYIINQRSENATNIQAAWCHYDLEQRGMEHIRASQTELITTMSGVRLCLFDAMVRLKMIRKFAFSWLHGCVPASNVPHDLPPD